MSDVLITLRNPDGGERQVRCRTNQSILEAAEDAGFALPYSCRSAACGTCAGRVLGGSVALDEQFVLGEGDLSAGFTLLCSAHPREACTILTHQSDQIEGG